MQISGKVFAVIGGGNGIGGAVVMGLANKGCHGDHAKHILTHVVNVTDRTAIAELPAAIFKVFLPELVRRPKAALVNVSSMGAARPFPASRCMERRRARLLSSAVHCAPN